jgi:hypothetical protein
MDVTLSTNDLGRQVLHTWLTLAHGRIARTILHEMSDRRGRNNGVQIVLCCHRIDVRVSSFGPCEMFAANDVRQGDGICSRPGLAD